MGIFRDEDFTSEVVSVESSGEGKLVTVRIVGPKIAPDFTREMRARGRALVAVGLVPSTVERIEDLKVGTLKTFTETVSGPNNISTGDVFVGQEFKVRVNE